MTSKLDQTTIAKVERALTLARSRLGEHPEFEIFRSIVLQLEYVHRVLRGEEDKSRMKDIILGLYAVREFEEADPEFAAALHAVNAMADRMARGLKP